MNHISPKRERGRVKVPGSGEGDSLAGASGWYGKVRGNISPKREGGRVKVPGSGEGDSLAGASGWYGERSSAPLDDID